MQNPIGRAGGAASCVTGVLVTMACIWGMSSAAAAHGALHEQIARASRAIRAAPDDAGLYLVRGELHHAHHDTSQALDDYAEALRLEPGLDAARLARGRLLAEVGRPADAVADLDVFLARHPEHAAARIARARARQTLGLVEAALSDFDGALSSADNPDWFLERARVARQLPADGSERARRGLRDALERLGPVPVLVLEAVDLELSAGNHGAALEQLDRLLTAAPRHPLWLARRGEILLALGRDADARRAFIDTLAAINQLPPSRRSTRHIAAVHRRAAAGLRAARARSVSVP